MEKEIQKKITKQFIERADYEKAKEILLRFYMYKKGYIKSHNYSAREISVAFDIIVQTHLLCDKPCSPGDFRNGGGM